MQPTQMLQQGQQSKEFIETLSEKELEMAVEILGTAGMKIVERFWESQLQDIRQASHDVDDIYMEITTSNGQKHVKKLSIREQIRVNQGMSTSIYNSQRFLAQVKTKYAKLERQKAKKKKLDLDKK